MKYEIKEGVIYAEEEALGTLVTGEDGSETLEHSAPIANATKGAIKRALEKPELKFDQNASEVSAKVTEPEPEPGTAAWATSEFAGAAKPDKAEDGSNDEVPGTEAWAKKQFA